VKRIATIAVALLAVAACTTSPTTSQSSPTTGSDPGDCIVIQTPGGAGYGDPAERDAATYRRERSEGLWVL